MSDDEEYPASYMVEYAKSNRSTCRVCGKKIEKGEVRIGITQMDEDIGHEITKWRHLKCAQSLFQEENKISDVNTLGQFKTLKKEDQGLVTGWLAAAKSKQKVLQAMKNQQAAPMEVDEPKPAKKAAKKKKKDDDDDDFEDNEDEPPAKKAKEEKPKKVYNNNKRRPEFGETLYSCEYAKSNRSTCKACQLKIEKDELRIGLTTPGEGDYDMTEWRHARCVERPLTVSDEETLESVEQIWGFETLKEKDQQDLRKWFSEVKAEPKGKKKAKKEDPAPAQPDTPEEPPKGEGHI
jgi:bifunctional polynucleotide phosphatase/kinase